MALKIRLRQQGRRNRIMYRLVLTNSRSPRDGKYIEVLGWYNPFESEPEKMISVAADRVQHWLDQGAIVTEKAEALIKKSAPQIVESYHKKVMEHQAKERAKRKALKKKKENVAAA